MTVELRGDLDDAVIQCADIAHVAILPLPIDVHFPQLIGAKISASCRDCSIKQPDSE